FSSAHMYTSPCRSCRVNPPIKVRADLNSDDLTRPTAATQLSLHPGTARNLERAAPAFRHPVARFGFLIFCRSFTGQMIPSAMGFCQEKSTTEKSNTIQEHTRT